MKSFLMFGKSIDAQTPRRQIGLWRRDVLLLQVPKCMVCYFRIQNLRRIKQRKAHCFIQVSSDNEDDKDNENDSAIFLPEFSQNLNAQNLRRIKQRKGLCFIQS